MPHLAPSCTWQMLTVGDESVMFRCLSAFAPGFGASASTQALTSPCAADLPQAAGQDAGAEGDDLPPVREAGADHHLRPHSRLGSSPPPCGAPTVIGQGQMLGVLRAVTHQPVEVPLMRCLPSAASMSFLSLFVVNAWIDYKHAS